MDNTPPNLVQKLSAEALGTMLFVLVGCGALATLTSAGGIELAAITLLLAPFAFGFAYAAAFFAFGRVSGGHFNPAVSVGSALSGRMSWKDAGLYSAAQVGGALVGAVVLMVLLIGTGRFDAFDDLGANGWGDDGTGYALWAALLLELVLTAVLVTLYLAITDERNEHRAAAPLALGVTIVALYAASIPLTGGSMNPARSVGTALVSGGDAIIQAWVFVLAPLLGAAAAGFAYPALFGKDREAVAGSGLNLSSGPKQQAYPGYGQPQGAWGQPGQVGQPGAQQGYAPPAGQGYEQPGQHAGQHAQPVAQQAPAEQPIIQDGWQWDPQAQQWIPAQQQAPQPPAAGGWAAPADESDRTQIRHDGV